MSRPSPSPEDVIRQHILAVALIGDEAEVETAMSAITTALADAEARGAEREKTEDDPLDINALYQIGRILNDALNAWPTDRADTFDLLLHIRDAFQNEARTVASSREADARDDAAETDLYETAVLLVRQHDRPSTSFVQRKLSLTYNAALAIMERMEREGVCTSRDRDGKRHLPERTEHHTTPAEK